MADDDTTIPGYTPRTRATPPAATTTNAPAATTSDLPGYTPRTSIAAAPSSGFMSNYVDPALASVGRLTNATVSEAQAPWSQIGKDVASTVREGQWLGADQPALAAARGISTDEQRKQDAEAYSRLGWAGMPATGVGYALGGGAMGVGKALAAEALPTFSALRPTVGRYLSGIVGASGEGGLANSASTLFHGGSVSDAIKAFYPGVAWGAGGGAIGGSQPDTPTNVSPVPKLKAQESQTYAPLDNIPYHGNDVTNNVNGTVNSIVQATGPNQWKNAKSTNAVVNDLLKQPWQSASDIQKVQEKLRGIQRSPTASNEDVRFAGQVASGLDQLHESAQPTYGPHGPGDAATILENGKPITQQRKNAEMLDEAQRQGRAANDPYVAASAAAEELKQNPQFYAKRDPNQQGGYDVNDPRYIAMKKIADSAPQGGPNYPYMAFKKGVGTPLTELGGAGLGMMAGHEFGHPFASAAVGLTAYPAFKAAQGAWRAGKTQSAFEQAYPELTGHPAPLQPFPGVLGGSNTARDFARMGIYSNEAQNQQ